MSQAIISLDDLASETISSSKGPHKLSHCQNTTHKMAGKGRNQTSLKLLLFLGYLGFGAQNMTQILAVSSQPHTTRNVQKLTRPDN